MLTKYKRGEGGTVITSFPGNREHSPAAQAGHVCLKLRSPNLSFVTSIKGANG